MRATTRTRATINDNSFSALSLVIFSDSETDYVYSTSSPPETDSNTSNDNQEEYQARVLEDCWQLEEQLRSNQQGATDSDNNREGDDEEEIMIITPAALKELCSSTQSLLHQYDTVQIRSLRQSIINGLMRITCETHDH